MKIQHAIPLFVLLAALANTSPALATDVTGHEPADLEAAAQIPEGDMPAQEVEHMSGPSHAAGGAHGGGHESGHGAGGGHNEWHFSGMFGSYDRAALQRGLKVYREVCSACHSLDRVYFRNLEALGYDEGQIKNIASQYTVIDGPNDEGEMYERPGLPSDHFVSPYLNENAAKASNNGALPPDLSLITKARHHGPDHVYGILTGYANPPPGTTLLPNQYWNLHMPGNIIAMAPPLSDGQVAYEDDAPQTVDQYARDVVEFLAWAADPYMEDRKRTGIKVLIFLAVFAGIMYAVKRKIWANLH